MEAVRTLPKPDVDPNGSSPEDASAPNSLLLIEDDPDLGPLLKRMLEDGGYEATLATSAEAARELLAGSGFHLAICDINLPGISGLDLLEMVAHDDPDLAIVIASGVSDPAIGALATERGAYGYLVKPFDQDQLLITVANALHRRRLEAVQREYGRRLERTVELRTRELRAAVSELSDSRRETITRLMRALEMRDGDTGAHIERIGRLAESLAGWAGVDEERAQMIGLAAPMHDIGKIGISDRILLKAGPLDRRERREIERHPEIGREILIGSSTELLQLAATIAASHHEWWDGTGYPGELAGEEIPLEGRIVAIVDVFDALHSERCYRPALTPEQALRMMRDERGTHFDPQLFDVFMDHYEEAMELFRDALVAAA
jgi:putative two-component system response regulator